MSLCKFHDIQYAVCLIEVIVLFLKLLRQLCIHIIVPGLIFR